MEQTELMLNDWVQVPSEINRYKHIRSTFDLDEAVLYKPIPLTPEILEKNGWVEDGYFYRHKELGYIQLGKLFEHASFDFTKYGINYRIQTSPRCMKYVHQLQHALRLCGIEKEIVL